MGLVKVLTKPFSKLTIKFDRTAYRKMYDSKYFKQKATCPVCGRVVTKHMLKRHMKTKRCKLRS